MSLVINPTRFAATVLAVSLSLIGTAHAAGFALMEQNASGLGNAYAGQAAAAEDASTIFFNPAGMTFIKGRQIVGALNAINPNADFNDEGSTPPTGRPLGGDGGDPGDLALVPNAYFSWEVVANQLWLGIGANAPFGLKTEYDDDWAGRFHATKSEVVSININPSIAWKVNDNFSLGGGVNFQRFKADLRNAVHFPGVNTEGTGKVEGDDWGIGWNIGAIFNFTPSTRLGLAYRSSIDFDLEGDATFSGVPGIPLLQAAFANGDVTADLETPESFSIALAHQVNSRLQVLADYTWTGWDSIQTLVVDRGGSLQDIELDLNFENSWRVGLGLNYQWNDAWKLRVGVAYDKTPVKDEFRTPRLPDEDRIWLAVGGQWKLSNAAVIDVGYAYIWADDASVDLPSVSPPSNLQRGNLVGEYDADVQIFSAQIRYSF